MACLLNNAKIPHFYLRQYAIQNLMFFKHASQSKQRFSGKSPKYEKLQCDGSWQHCISDILRNQNRLLQKLQHQHRCDNNAPRYAMSELYTLVFNGLRIISYKQYQPIFLQLPTASAIKTYNMNMFREKLFSF